MEDAILVQDAERVVEALMRAVGFTAAIRDLADMLLNLIGRTDKLAFLAGANPNLPDDVVQTYKELFQWK